MDHHCGITVRLDPRRGCGPDGVGRERRRGAGDRGVGGRRADDVVASVAVDGGEGAADVEPGGGEGKAGDWRGGDRECVRGGIAG